MDSKTLAILGGTPAVQSDPENMFMWSQVTSEHEDAILKVLRDGSMSGLDITKQFEEQYKKTLGRKYALGHNNGTAALQSAMYGLGIGVGDEIICPSLTYWASCLPVYSLGGTIVFAEVDPETLCIDPNDIEHRISERTKAIVVVHFGGMPADMDPIMAIARKHDIKVIEDVSHAHGGLYKGREVGSIGDVAAMSLMSGKSLPIGEAGIMLTDNKEVYEKAILWGHYVRQNEITTPKIKENSGLPWGGYKYRMHQMSAAMGIVQLSNYPTAMSDMDKAMNYFWDGLEGVKGLRAIRPKKESASTRAGWYSPSAHYLSEELDGLSLARFAEAVSAESSVCYPYGMTPLHSHPLFNTVDVYGHGKPTRIANLPEGVDVRQSMGSLPVTENVVKSVFSTPWFKEFNKKILGEHIQAYKKVSENYQSLLADDPGDPETINRWSTFH